MDLFHVAQPKPPVASTAQHALYYLVELRDLGLIEKPKSLVDHVEALFQPNFNRLNIQVTPHVGTAAEDIPRVDFIRSFTNVKETNLASVAVAINRQAAACFGANKRGWPQYIYANPAMQYDRATLFDARYDHCGFDESVPPGEFFICYFGSAMDRGWLVLEDGSILRQRNWDAYGARVRVV